jgi:hypothetical protein
MAPIRSEVGTNVGWWSSAGGVLRSVENSQGEMSLRES